MYLKFKCWNPKLNPKSRDTIGLWCNYNIKVAQMENIF